MAPMFTLYIIGGHKKTESDGRSILRSMNGGCRGKRRIMPINHKSVLNVCMYKAYKYKLLNKLCRQYFWVSKIRSIELCKKLHECQTTTERDVINKSDEIYGNAELFT